MDVPILDQQCFGCCSNRIQALSIGYLSMGIAFFNLMITASMESEYFIKLKPDASQNDINWTILLHGIPIAVEVILFITTILNVYGIHKVRPNFIRPWLVVNTIVVILHVFLSTRTLMVHGYYVRNQLIICFIGRGINLFVLLIGSCYYGVLKNHSNRKVCVKEAFV